MRAPDLGYAPRFLGMFLASADSRFEGESTLHPKRVTPAVRQTNMRRTIEIETSQFSNSPTKRWVGLEYLVEDAIVEYPDELDYLDDNELLEMADNDENSVHYVDASA